MTKNKNGAMPKLSTLKTNGKENAIAAEEY